MTYRSIALLGDFCWRARSLDKFSKASLLSEAFFEVLPSGVRASFERADLDVDDVLRDSRRLRFDVGIVTVIKAELQAMLKALGRRPNADPDDRRGTTSFWFCSVQTGSQRTLSIVLIFVGEARNVPCAIAVCKLLSTFDVGLLLLAGVAAGVRKRTKLGDVVYAEHVYDYEHVRREVPSLLKFWRWYIPLTIERPRPELWPVPKLVTGALARCEWGPALNRFKELIGEFPDLPEGALDLTPDIERGTIAAGEKLFADGSLSRMHKTFDHRIRAGDQEDSGFAQAAESFDKPYAIFRGICDFGDPNKGQKWQLTAALSASCAAVHFLQSVWSSTNVAVVPSHAQSELEQAHNWKSARKVKA